ncbi:MAG: glycosyltransferase family 2 protein [Candidatus Sumerlaeota bacterium]
MPKPDSSERSAYEERVLGIVLNWNGADDTIELLKSLDRLTWPYFEILVVDNGSSDNSVEKITEAFPKQEILQTGANLGYAGGNNAGLKTALKRGCDYALVLNNDLTVETGLVEKLLEPCRTDSTIALAGPKVYRADKPDRLFYPAWKIDWKKWLFYRVEGSPDPSGITDVAYIQGCALLIRREFMEQEGLFDEKYHLYCEDADLSVRAQRAGWRTVEVEEAKVWHEGYGSSGKNSPLKTYYGLRNRLLFIGKHVPRSKRFPLIWRLLVFDAGRQFFGFLKLIFTGRFHDGFLGMRALCRAIFDWLVGRFNAGPVWLFRR